MDLIDAASWPGAIAVESVEEWVRGSGWHSKREPSKDPAGGSIAAMQNFAEIILIINRNSQKFNFRGSDLSKLRSAQSWRDFNAICACASASIWYESASCSRPLRGRVRPDGIIPSLIYE
jgi:hypothetical protein